MKFMAAAEANCFYFTISIMLFDAKVAKEA